MKSIPFQIFRKVSFPLALALIAFSIFYFRVNERLSSTLINTNTTSSLKSIDSININKAGNTSSQALKPLSKVIDNELNLQSSKFNQTVITSVDQAKDIPQIQKKNAVSKIIANGQYQIDSNTHLIYDPSGNEFKMKSVTAFFGRFSSGWLQGLDTAGKQSFDNRTRDLDQMQAMGINSIRIFVSSYYYNNPSKVYPSLPSDTFMSNLDTIVTEASNRGMIIELTNANTVIRDKVVQWTDANGQTYSDKLDSYVDFTRDTQGRALESNWLSMLATHYASNNKVWIQPENEPNCEEWIPNGPYQNLNCINWNLWQSEQQQFINAIRNAGNKQPIIINTPQWTGSLLQRNADWSIKYHLGTQIPYSIIDYQLHDSLNSLEYAVHIYPDPYRSNPLWQPVIDIADQNFRWGNYTEQFSVVPDELGQKVYKDNRDQWDWNIGFLNYIATSTNENKIPGASIFTWFWGDNSMINSVTDSSIDNGQLSYWGQLTQDNFFNKVVTTPVINYKYTYNVPFLSNGKDGINTYMTMKNTVGSLSNINIHYYSSDGSTVQSSNTCTIILSNANCIPSNPYNNAQNGSAVITSDQTLNILVSETTPLGQTAYPVSLEISNSIIDTLAFNNTYGGFKTALNIFNTSSHVANSVAQFYNSEGIIQTTKTFDIPAFGLFSLNQSAINSNLPLGFNGYIKVLSSQPIKAQVIEQNDLTGFISASSAQTLNGDNDTNGVSNTLIASGIYNSAFGSFTTGMNIVNTSNNDINVAITYYDSNGKAYISSPFVMLANKSVGIFDSNTSGIGLPTGGLPKGFEGYAKITSTGGKIAISVNENGNQNGKSLNGTYTAQSKMAEVINIPVISKGNNGYTTGYSLFNTSNIVINVNIQYFNLDGSASISKAVSINPFSTFDMYQGSENLPNNFYGSARISQLTLAPESLISITNATSSYGFYTYTQP